MKNIFRIFSTLCIYLALFFPSMEAQTQSILYLKNGSIIKCNLVRVISDSMLVIQTVDSIQMEFQCNQVDNLIYSQSSFTPISATVKNETPKRPTSAGFFLGSFNLLGEYGKQYYGGLYFGTQLGAGINPGFRLQIGCGLFSSASLGKNELILTALIGPRFSPSKPESKTGIFFSPMVGMLTAKNVKFAIGLSTDAYFVSHIFVGVRYFGTVNFGNSSTWKTENSISFISFVLGYGIN